MLAPLGVHGQALDTVRQPIESMGKMIIELLIGTGAWRRPAIGVIEARALELRGCLIADEARATSHAPVAQRIEHLTTDQKVGGSNPSGRTLVETVALLCRGVAARESGPFSLSRGGAVAGQPPIWG
jgi:hypothetical protein